MPYTSPHTRFWQLVNQKADNECWTWLGYRDRNRYGQFNDGTKIVYAHIYSFILAGNVLIPGNYVLHSCDVPACVNPKHLFQGTQKDNIQDCKLKGRNNKGKKNGHAKLTENDVINILKELKDKDNHELGSMYGVSYATISDIRRGITWKHVRLST